MRGVCVWVVGVGGIYMHHFETVQVYIDVIYHPCYPVVKAKLLDEILPNYFYIFPKFK